MNYKQDTHTHTHHVHHDQIAKKKRKGKSGKQSLKTTIEKDTLHTEKQR